MTPYRQKRKWFLSVVRPTLSVDRQNLSFRFERFQSVDLFAFLINQNHQAKSPAPPQRVIIRWRRRRVELPFKDPGDLQRMQKNLQESGPNQMQRHGLLGA
jgi:hypothetical protein